MVKGKDYQVGWCCDEGRVFLIFSLLCGVERIKTDESSRPSSSVSPGSTPPLETGGVGGFWSRRSQLPKGVGYGYTYSNKRAKTSSAENKSVVLAAYFSALKMVLPQVVRQTVTPFDALPHRLVTAMVPRSPMLQKSFELLRGADMEEVCDSNSAFNAALGFLDTLAGHWNTGRYIIRDRVVYSPTEQLLHITMGSQPWTGTASVTRETAEPLHVVLGELAVRCRKFLQASSRVTHQSSKHEHSAITNMKRICAMAEALEKLRPQDPPPSARNTRLSAAREAAKQAAAWHRENCVKALPDEVILKNFHLVGEVKASEKAQPANGRMRKLLTQLASLSTDLPEGIYVRHGEGRPDIIKVLITGPVGTPYENGLFEFDMFCGKNFPNKPPKMHFRTTGSKASRFNPNLYTNGKSELPAFTLKSEKC